MSHKDWCAKSRNPVEATAPVLCNCPAQIEAFAIAGALSSDKAERVLADALADVDDYDGKRTPMERSRELLAALREGLAPKPSSLEVDWSKVELVEDWCNDDTHTHAPGECPNKIDH